MIDSELSRLTIGDVIDRQADRFGDRDCVVYPAREARSTYRQFGDRVATAARGLMTIGVRKGEHVAVWSRNLPEWNVLQFATAKIGAVLVPINTSFTARELETVLRHSESTTLFLGSAADGALLSILREVLPDVDDAPVGHARFDKLPRLARLFSIGPARLAGMLRYDDLADLAVQTHPDDYRRRSEALDSFDVIMIPYTGGTTGFPKGVMLTHRNLIVTAWHMGGGLDASPDDRVCAPIPLHQCFASIGASIGSVMRGACYVGVEAFAPDAVLDAAVKERCTILQATPSMLAQLCDDPAAADGGLPGIRVAITGGAPLPTTLARDVEDRLGVAQLCVGYGLTEASAGVTRSSPGDPPEKRLGTVGRGLPHVRLKVVDPRSGDDLAPGAEGELCCRGLGEMKGYFKDPEGTAEAIDAEGWLHTKDLATIDLEGFVHIVGRLRDMIIRHGEKIYPREVEVFLYSHPKIADVHVIGVPNRVLGEDVCAAVKLRTGEELTLEEVIEFCSGRLQPEKIPSLLLTVRDFPMTAGGKVMKSELRRMAVERFGRQSDAAATA